MCSQSPARKCKSLAHRYKDNIPTSCFLVVFFFYIFSGIFPIIHYCSSIQIVDSPAEVADKADRIITMLPSSPNVMEVYTGSNGILKCILVFT